MLDVSVGDFLSQPIHSGGLGHGTTGTSAILLVIILGMVVYLTNLIKSRIDETPQPE